MGSIMRHVTADFADTTIYKQHKNHNLTTDALALDRRYGQIGISAVAAAARYQGGAKNAAYAPGSSNWHDRNAEEAA
jgi:hypothetical protein